jgi:predicted ArsR family transcriptional regulator
MEPTLTPLADRIGPLSLAGGAMDVASGDERGTRDRVPTLLRLPQQRQFRTAPELADPLGVMPRTVRRDVERLSALGYLMHAIRNRSSARNRQSHL